MDNSVRENFQELRSSVFTRVGQLRVFAFLLAAIGCALWLAFLFLQTGSGWDESEHAHVAWMISRGKRPLDDFFQHHQPLLWHLLSLYYRAGFTGAGVLIWGRTLVVLSALVAMLALLRLGRAADGRGITIAGAVGAGLFAGLTYLIPELFVTRPETVSTALMLVALVLWSIEGRPGVLRILTAGALAGAACYASPRFLLLGGFFFLCGVNCIRRWGLLLCGGALFGILYTAISGIPLEHVLFNLRFSSYLQSVGTDPVGLPVEFWELLCVAMVVPMVSLIATGSSNDKVRGGLLLGNLVAIFVACDATAGQFQYAQAYSPFVIGATIVVTLLLVRFKVSFGWRMVGGLFVGTLLLLASIGQLRPTYATSEFTPFEQVQADNAIAALVPPHRAVLVYAIHQPITVQDAYYYGSPLFDAQDRLCRAVRGFQSSISLPPCDFFQIIQAARPYILDARIDRAVRPEEVSALKQWLAEHYEHLRLSDTMSLKIRLRYQLLVEKSEVARAGDPEPISHRR